MNERIKELAVQAKLEHCVSHARLEDFAQLIIKECANIADTKVPNSLGCGYITKTTGTCIKEYFGVN